jgi:hypothetical protein
MVVGVKVVVLLYIRKRITLKETSSSLGGRPKRVTLEPLTSMHEEQQQGITSKQKQEPLSEAKGVRTQVYLIV